MSKRYPKTSPDLSPERVQIHLRSRFSPIRGLTPDVLSRQIDNFKLGNLRDFALTADAIEERDDVLRCVAPKRKKAVARCGWEVLTVDDSAEARRQQQALTKFYDSLVCTNAVDLNERGSFKLLVRQMMDAVGKRYAVHEIIWKPGQKLSAEFRFVSLWFFENTTGQLRFLTSEAVTEGKPLEEGGWMVTVADGLMVSSAIAWMYKHMPLSHWLTYCERHGMPGIRGITGAARGSAEWEAMREAVADFATEFAAVMNEGEAIEAIDLKGQGESPYPALVERMDRALAALWRGADLSTMSKGGDPVGASVQGDETSLLEEDDAETISETLNLYVDKWVVRYLFGEQAEVKAYVRLLTSQRPNLEQDLKIDEFLLRHGAPVAIADALERYGRAMPKSGEPCLNAASAPEVAAPVVESPQPTSAEHTDEPVTVTAPALEHA